MAASAIETQQPDLRDIAAFVRTVRGVDLDAYRPTTVQRRVTARMQRLGVSDPERYLALLRETPAEADELLRFVRINVTRFFRSAPAVRALSSQVIPALAAVAADRPVRVWSAGCSTGEEPYTLLMLLDGALPRDGALDLLATDVDGTILSAAQPDQASYSPEAFAELPEAMRERYFEAAAGHPRLRPNSRLRELAGAIRWGRHDLLSLEPPAPSSFDLISCRNVLIYFSPAEQRRVQAFLADRLAPGGFLFLGEAEALTSSVAEHFEVVDQSARLYCLRSPLTSRGAPVAGEYAHR